MDTTAVLEAGTLDALIGLVRQHTGIAMNERKSVLLQGRLRPRMRALALSRYEDYLELLRCGGTEVQTFIDMVTTNDTVFFRTPAVWSWVEQEFLPGWHAAHPGQCLRIWSAAAASGEEAYSMAMLCDQFQVRNPSFRFQIMATDINTAVLAAAQAGHYAGRSVDKLALSHPQLLQKYFTRSVDGISASAALRLNLAFSVHNLLQPMRPHIDFHLVLLRNVLIYFDEENQRRVLEQCQRQMAPGARLVLGEQESITRLGTRLVFEQSHVYSVGETP